MDIIVLSLGVIIFISYGVADFLSARVSTNMLPNTILFYQKLFSVILFTVGAFMYFGFPVLTKASVLPLLFMGMASYLGLFFFFKTLKNGLASVVVPIANSYIVFSTVFAYLFLGEVLTPLKYIAVAMVVIGVFLISINNKHICFSNFFKSNTGVFGAILTAFFWSIGLTLMKMSQAFVSPFSVIFVSDIIVLTLSFVVLLLGVKNTDKNMFKFEQKKQILSIAALFFIAFVAINYGMLFSGVTLIGVFIASAPLVTLVLARYYLNEHLYKHQYLAAVLILSGLMIISI